jgi:hypothetical protein
LCEELGDTRAACAAFLRTRQLELEIGLPPWAPNTEAFLMFTDKAVNALDEELRGYLKSAQLYIADLPGPEVVVEGVDPRSTTLVDAVLLGPEDEQAELEVNAEQVSLRVFLYAMNIMRAASGLHDVQQTIQEALETEVRTTLDELREELAEELSLTNDAFGEMASFDGPLDDGQDDADDDALDDDALDDDAPEDSAPEDSDD